MKNMLITMLLFFTTSTMCQTIEMLVPFPVGGGTDIVARNIQQELSRDLGLSITLLNKPGGDGAVAGAEFLLNNNTNKILVVSTGTSLFAKLKRRGTGTFDPIDNFDIIGPVATTPLIITVSAQKFLNWDDFAQQARTKGVSCGTSSASATFFIRAVAAKEKLNINSVPFRGSTDVVNNLMGQQIDCGVDGLGGPFTELVKANMVRIIASSTKHGNVPVLDFGNYKFYSFFGLALHKNMDPALKQRIVDSVVKLHANQDFVSKMNDKLFAVPPASANFTRTLQQDYTVLDNMRSRWNINLE